MRQTNLPIDSIESLGVDWITATYKAGYSASMWSNLADRLLLSERARDNFVMRWSSLGYEGFRCGQVQLGTREDGAIIRLSGNCAAREWEFIADTCDNVPRLDLQVTVRDLREPNSRILKHLKQVKRRKRSVGRGPTLTLIRSDDGGCTLYIGKRSSCRMGRIYNKRAESGLDYYEGCVRYEVELKDGIGYGVAKWVRGCSSFQHAIATQVTSYFCERGITLPAAVAAISHMRYADIPRGPEKSSDVFAKLLWLSTQVRPTVERLTAAGHSAMVHEVLGLPYVAQSEER